MRASIYPFVNVFTYVLTHNPLNSVFSCVPTHYVIHQSPTYRMSRYIYIYIYTTIDSSTHARNYLCLFCLHTLPASWLRGKGYIIYSGSMRFESQLRHRLSNWFSVKFVGLFGRMSCYNFQTGHDRIISNPYVLYIHDLTLFDDTFKIALGKAKQSRYTPCGDWGERRYSSYSFTASAQDGGEWSTSRPCCAFTPGERTPGTHCTGGWVGPRAGLDTERIKEKSFAPAGDRTPIARSSSP
jgi:hypothetical protein